MYVCIFKIDQLEGGKEKETKRNGGMCQGPVLGKRARVGGRARAHVCARCWSALLRACMLVGLVGNSGRGYIVKGRARTVSAMVRLHRGMASMMTGRCVQSPAAALDVPTLPP